ncbi:Dephospho-CoA kinase [subsurface metagenome]
MLKVGITGGIGSGKSTVCKIFNSLGIPVYHADTRAKYLTIHTSDIREVIINEFGPDSFIKETYNTKYISSKVFNNPALLKKLNCIIHPYVAEDFNEWLNGQKKQIYVIQEAAILFESDAYKKMDRIIVVNAPLDIRIRRITERDNISKEEILKKMKNQWSTEKLLALADWVINNDDNKLILPQIISIHNQLIS